jgi:hypothetical protein
MTNFYTATARPVGALLRRGALALGLSTSLLASAVVPSQAQVLPAATVPTDTTLRKYQTLPGTPPRPWYQCLRRPSCRRCSLATASAL